MRKPYRVWMPILLVCFATVAASAQSFRVQCPTNTITHPDTTPTQLVNSAEPTYSGPTSLVMGPSAFLIPDPAAKNANGAIKYHQISRGDVYSTMAAATPTYIFSSVPLAYLPVLPNA